MRPRTAQSGFSLAELMVAIIILGIGMTMVATVFPVAIRMSGDTVQMSIAHAASDAALATVQIRVPVAYNLNGDMDADDLHLFDPSSPPPLYWPEPATFTEVSGWDGDVYVGTAGGIPPGNAVEATRWAFALWMQNLPADWRTAPFAGIADLDERPPVPDFTGPPFLLSDVTNPSRLPCVSLFDRVYPPVAVEVKYNRTLAGWDTTDPNLVDPTDPGNIASILDHVRSGELASRRYAWHVLHRRRAVTTANETRSLILTIVVTHRADLGARFARQYIPLPPPPFTPADIPDGTTGTWPLAPEDPSLGPPSPDTLFPQMWLVRLTEVNPSTGQLTCTRAVADLLPTSSTFIIARTPPYNPMTQPDPEMFGFGAGMPHKVIRRLEYPPYTPPGDLTVLEIAKTEFMPPPPAMANVAVWVIPPPIERIGNASYRFGDRSPVIGTFLREVDLP
ncbi:MAG: prepilin-type N-terminal cleavage/methylation domain-containing protein [Phycisphaerae bacterium]|nr:prepilin-type N-terminal cleavage/methylation domain-containing protein [Phycisphaerae bacterium]